MTDDQVRAGLVADAVALEQWAVEFTVATPPGGLDVAARAQYERTIRRVVAVVRGEALRLRAVACAPAAIADVQVAALREGLRRLSEIAADMRNLVLWLEADAHNANERRR